MASTEGQSNLTSEPIDDPKISCRSLTDEEQGVLLSHRTRLRDLVGDSAEPITASELDAAWSRWQSSASIQTNLDVSAFGIGLGDELVRLLGFTWQHCTDAYGDGLAVIALPGKADVTVYPEDFVSKRHERSEGAFFGEAIKQIGTTLSEMSDPTPVSRTPG